MEKGQLKNAPIYSASKMTCEATTVRTLIVMPYSLLSGGTATLLHELQKYLLRNM